MEQRLQLFLQMEQLTQSQFADKLGIQRSGVTHLLSGRNKPSFEFITRMLQTFPSLNAEWLILGKGKPYRDHSAPDVELPPAATETTPAEADLFTPMIQSQTPDIIETTDFGNTPQLPDNKVTEQKYINSNQPKAIKSVLILYEDGTYEKR
jgi:transcriptional regulator with XRE-family HTH domain